MAYDGPERRKSITFTREDSDRLVRLEQTMISLDTKIGDLSDELTAMRAENVAIYSRLNKAERRLSWLAGIGAAITFMLTTALTAFKLLTGK